MVAVGTDYEQQNENNSLQIADNDDDGKDDDIRNIRDGQNWVADDGNDDGQDGYDEDDDGDHGDDNANWDTLPRGTPGFPFARMTRWSGYTAS